MIGLAASLYPALSLYAVAYVAVPAVRYALLSKRNAQIAQRNEARRVWRDALRSGGAALRKKLGSARSRSGKVRVVGEADLAFDSAKGLAEQPTDAEVAAVGGGVGGGVVVVVVGGGGGGDSGGGGRRDGRAVVEWPSHLLTHSLAPAQADDWERRLNARG